MKGWYGDPYRHSIAARGISLKSRKELDYALHKRGEIYPGEIGQHSWYEFIDKHGDKIERYTPVPGEIRALNDLRNMIELYTKSYEKKHLTTGDINVLRSHIKDFMMRVKITDVTMWSRKDEYIMMVKYLHGWSGSDARDVLLASDVMFYLMHWDDGVVESYIGRNPDESSMSRMAVQWVMDLQRIEERPGDAILFLDIWIQELERRRLT